MSQPSPPDSPVRFLIIGLKRSGTTVTQHLCAGIRMPFYKEVQIGMPIYFRLKRTWKNQRPDIVHIITEGPLGFAALLAARKLKIPVISDYRTNYQQYARHYKVGFIQRLAVWLGD